MISNIRDNAITKIANIIYHWGYKAEQPEFGASPPTLTDKDIQKAKHLLNTVKEIAIVDREAELPRNPHERLRSNNEINPSYQIYAMAQRDMRVNGWVKELK